MADAVLRANDRTKALGLIELAFAAADYCCADGKVASVLWATVTSGAV